MHTWPFKIVQVHSKQSAGSTSDGHTSNKTVLKTKKQGLLEVVDGLEVEFWMVFSDKNELKRENV